eukprot:SAG11_NODE_1917_length_4070_cov_3.642156_1_plen_45_part_00
MIQVDSNLKKYYYYALPSKERVYFEHRNTFFLVFFQLDLQVLGS